MKTILMGVLLGGLLLAGCQLPLAPKSQGFQLTLHFSSPSLRGVEAPSRVLLPTAAKVTLTVASEGKTLDTQTVSTSGQSAVTFVLNLPPLATYDLKAEARNAGGTLVFAGSTSVKLLGSLSGTLNLFPVDAAGSMSGWAAVTSTPANQPAGGSVAQSLSLNTGESQSFFLDWGAGSAFTFQTAAGLQIYLQTATGSPVTIPTSDQTVLKSSAPGSAWITYYAPSAPVALATLGRFAVPAQSVTTDASVLLNKGDTKQLSFAVAPVNADNQSLTDFTWSSSASQFASVDASGLVTAVDNGEATITVSSNVVPGVTDSVLVKVAFVAVPVTSVTLAAPSGPLVTGDTTTLAATVLPANATDKALLWSSSLPGVAAVDQDSGLITAVAPGTTTITATSADGPAGSQTIVVVPGTFELHSRTVSTWVKEASAPLGTTALAGNNTLLYALTDTGSLVQYLTGIWNPVMVLPAGLVHLAVAPDGTLYAADADSVYQFTGTWQQLPGLVPGLSGLAVAGDGQLYVSSATQLMVRSQGLWTAVGSLPAGFQSLGGGDGVYASTGVTFTTPGTLLKWDVTRWVTDGTLPAGSLAFTAWGGTVKALKAY